MNIRLFFLLLCMVPGAVSAASRGDSARVGVNRVSNAAARMPAVPTLSAYLSGANVSVDVDKPADKTEPDDDKDGSEGGSLAPGGSCRDAYRACMDEFCLLDESEGARCGCSNAIDGFQGLIQEIKDIQAEADRIYTEDVERAQMGAATADLIKKKINNDKNAQNSGMTAFEKTYASVDSGVDEDDDTQQATTEGAVGFESGEELYKNASEFCAAELKACGSKAEMEALLYSRQIAADCKAFGSYLEEQKINAQANKRTAEAAVRKTLLGMLDTTDKYNRGECLLAYKACVADKGGCGSNFENCLDEDMLDRRAAACEGVLNQCQTAKNDVLEDWDKWTETILDDAGKYAEQYFIQNCRAKIRLCLEEACSAATDSMCATNTDMAKTLCPIITECDTKVAADNENFTGFTDWVEGQLGYLQIQFCQNDLDSCLRDKCGENFNAPECIGKKISEIQDMCPQAMFPSCKGVSQFDTILSAVSLQMDYQLMQGCVNYFSEQLGNACGTDMTCLSADPMIEALSAVPTTEADKLALRGKVIANAESAVDEFFTQFEQDTLVDACKDSTSIKNDTAVKVPRKSLGVSVFTTAKFIAKNSAANRALRALDAKIAELSRQQDLEKAEANCYALKDETPDESSKNYSYVRSVVFEPDLRNCHVCRMQRVCEVGGESKAAAALKAAGGGLSAGAATGTMINAGWGTAIGGIIGAVGAGALGAAEGGEKEFCQEIESCEDVNM